MSDEHFQLDASALLALLRDEPGSQRVLECLTNSVIHVVNLAEVLRKMLRNGVPAAEAQDLIDKLQIPIVSEINPLEVARAGHQWPSFSLGDCVCLTSARLAGRIALTTEQAWRGLPLVEVIRRPNPGRIV